MPKEAADNAETRQRFLEQLPWWLNHTLDDAGSAWMQAAVQRWPWAAQAATRELALVRGLAAPEPIDATLGLEALLTRVQAAQPDSSIAAPQTVAPSDRVSEAAAARGRTSPEATLADHSDGLGSRLASWLETTFAWLAGPRLGPALAMCVLLQAGVIVWMGQAADEQDTAIRSTPVTEVRTLRVTPAPGLSEAQWRAALLASGARIVGGPTQLGEYWLASDMRSLDEIQAELLAAGAVTQAEVDREGPRGR